MKLPSLPLFSATTALALALVASSQAQNADTIFINGRIVTLDASERMAEALGWDGLAQAVLDDLEPEELA